MSSSPSGTQVLFRSVAQVWVSLMLFETCQDIQPGLQRLVKDTDVLFCCISLLCVGSCLNYLSHVAFQAALAVCRVGFP